MKTDPWWKPRLIPIVGGLMSLFLMLSLTSCATRSVPARYLQDCTITYWTADTMTQGDLVRLAKEREYDVIRCNVDKAAIREWLRK